MEGLQVSPQLITAVAYLALLLLAAGWDVWRMVIPNALVVTLLALFVVAVLFVPGSGMTWWSHLAAGALVLMVGLGLYGFRVMGAGDVKLIAVIGVWAGLDLLPLVLLTTVLAGGGLAIMILALRRIALGLAIALTRGEQVRLPRSLQIGEKLPYGVAIAVGGAVLIIYHPFLSGIL